MRTTQFIGLNDYARKWLEQRKLLYQTTVIIGYGMFEEPIHGLVCHLESDYPDVNVYLKISEVIQASPWSSGPMIFTHLKAELQKKEGSLCDMGFYFSWMMDPSLKGQEYDYETGRY